LLLVRAAHPPRLAETAPLAAPESDR
jgi:hypothetical protein